MLPLFSAPLGSAPVFRQLLNTAQLVAATHACVLILGESGSGKEVLARYLHAHSPRAKQPFIAVNCAALPENLVESELFGHRRGAFSHAAHDRDGMIRAAGGGTLFLDEVGELPLAAQAKLLRFLENSEIQPLGCDHPVSVDVRVVAATNGDLDRLVAAGRFRADLFFRLQVVPLEMTPLRDRASDVPLLAAHFVRQAAAAHGLRPIAFSPHAMDALKTYAWPGNVRELKNLCERLTILCAARAAPLTMDNLPPAIRNGGKPPPLAGGGFSLAHSERALILQALHQAQGNKTRAAGLLGISRYTLLYRLKKYFPGGAAGVSSSL
ncbi:MAG TPA: sigma-54-dependent Fis family transcriptional regulator [Betaproteobacteria bacterium]|nr:sigma-54-dependent Fis family transcriptional regulator [Betaproteobacteria bacterium]